YDLRSWMVIAHIRKANPPVVGRSYANTHPFEREAGGRAWVFAHNGMLPGIERFRIGRYTPMGDSDSEHAFCVLMEVIHNCIDQAGRLVDIDQSLNCLEPAISEINPLDEFNFLLGNGESLFVHAHSELHLLKRNCIVDGCDQQVILIATKPLSEEPWQCLVPNTLLVLEQGEIIRELRTRGRAAPQAWERRRAQARLEAEYQSARNASVSGSPNP
ncbi:MAG: class II glutamine amidotransferase, partial [Wenzhouxiangella sp.]